MKRVTYQLVVYIIVVLFFQALGLTHAQQVNSNARMAGMAYSSSALVNGVDAIGTNPAQIPLPKENVVSIALLPVSFFAGTDFIDYETYKKYFTGVPGGGGKREPYYLKNEDKDFILRSFQDGVGNFSASARYQLLAATISTSFGSLGISMTDRIASKVSIPQPFFEFLLHGNTPGKTFDFKETNIASSWTREYSVTFAKRFAFNPRRQQAFSVGATMKYLHGYGYFGVDRFDSRFTTDPDSFVVTGTVNMHAAYAGTEWIAQKDIFKFQLFPTPVGNGFGVDIGAHAELSNNVRIGVSLTDLGAVRWNRHAKEISANEDFTINDISSDEQFEQINEKLNGKEFTVASFTTALPTALTISGAYSVIKFLGSDRPLNLAITVQQGFNEMPGNSTTPRIGIGTEWEFLEALPFRIGAAGGGALPVQFSIGLGLRMERFTIDLATANLASAFTQNFSSASFAISSRLDF